MVPHRRTPILEGIAPVILERYMVTNTIARFAKRAITVPLVRRIDTKKEALTTCSLAFTMVGTITTTCQSGTLFRCDDLQKVTLTVSLVLCAHALLGARTRYLGVILFITSVRVVRSLCPP